MGILPSMGVTHLRWALLAQANETHAGACQCSLVGFVGFAAKPQNQQTHSNRVAREQSSLALLQVSPIEGYYQSVNRFPEHWDFSIIE
jgi:hypothetical protein